MRDAATVLLVRDAPRLELLMLRRNLHSVFVPGAHVFPGGALEPSDAAPEVAARCIGRTDAGASRLMGLDRGGLASFVAAIRETFEEAGVLLARHADTRAPLDLSEPAVAARFAAHRAAVDGGDARLVDVLEAEDLVLDIGAMHFFAHWITPLGAPRRYDTRFFVAAAPEGQVAVADQREVLDHVWIDAATALAQYGAGDIELIFPTLRSLETVADFDSAADLLAALAAAVDATGRAAMVGDHGGRRVVLPGDAPAGPVAAAGGAGRE